MIIVGFDWARDKHDVAVQSPDGNWLHRGVVAHDAASLEQLRVQLSEMESDPAQVHVALEQHDGALLAWILHCGYTLYAVNPKSADRAREIYHPAGGKSDKVDARVLADLLRNNLPRFKPMHAQSEATLRLRSLSRLRTRLNDQKTAHMQRLRTILAEWSPLVSNLCNDFNRIWQRDLVRQWPLHEDLANVHGNTINAFMSEHRMAAATRDKLQATRKAQVLYVPKGRQTALRLEIEHILQQLQDIIERLKQLDDELEAAFQAHPSYDTFYSLPVKGTSTLAMIASAYGDERDDPPSWRHLAARWGVAPITYASGKSRAVHRRRACDTHVLQALTDLAFTTAFSVKGCWAKEFYRRKRDEGKDHHEALRAVALRWVKILWRLWHDQDLYDEEYHQRNKRLQSANSCTSAAALAHT